MGKYGGKRLYDVPWEDVHIGMKVISPKGTRGEITGLHPFPEDEDSIDFKWENGNEAFGVFHLWTDNIIVLH